MTGLTDISHFDLFRILDYLKADCEKRNKNEPIFAIKYIDIFNFAGSCRKLRRIVRSWSKTMYDDLEIDMLQEVAHSHLSIRFMEMHKRLKGATAEKVDMYLDIYVRAMLKNPLLKKLELRLNSESFSIHHQYIFDEIVLAICGQSKRVVLDKEQLPRIKEITVNIPDRSMSNLIALANTRIKKLSLNASFAISDLGEFCARNPALVTLEINAYSFSDHGQLNQVVGHCPALKRLKFVMSDNARDREYVKLALLDKLQHLEIAKQPVQIMDFGRDEDHMVEDMASERARSNNYHDDDPILEHSTPLLLLIKALMDRKKSKLVQLRLTFKVNDNVVQAIAQLKGLKMLECGFCDTKSIGHLKSHPTLSRLTIRNMVITDDAADVLKKNVIVSNYFAKMYLNQRGHLYIGTNDAVLLRVLSFDSLLRILENLKSLWLSEGLHMVVEREREINWEPKSRHLCMLNVSVLLYKEFPLSLVRDLHSFQVVSTEPPTIRFLENLVKYHRNTLQDICIEIPGTLFKLPKLYYLNESRVVTLTFLSSLRKVSCGVQELKFIQRLAQLKDLDEITVLSEHDPQDIHMSLVPLLINCRKLSSFTIKVSVSGINQAFVEGLQNAVMKHRDPDLQDDLEICLMITEPITPEQQTLIAGPLKLMTVRAVSIEQSYIIE